MSKRKRRTVTRNQKEHKGKSLLSSIVYIGLYLILFYPPYFRGLFFTREQLLTHLFSFTIFGLWWFEKRKRGEYSFFHCKAEYIIIGFVIAYFASIFISVNVRNAIGGFLKVSNYFLLYWLVADIVWKSHRHVDKFLNIMLLSAFGVALIGIGSAAGTWQYTGALVGGRIASTLQYPNTTAVYMISLLMVSLAQWVLQNTNEIYSYIYGAASYVLFITFLFTQSRGALLVLPLALVALFYLLPKGFRVKCACATFNVLVVTVITAPLFAKALRQGTGVFVWSAVILGVLLVVGIERGFNTIAQQSRKTKLVSTAVVVIIALFIGGIYINRNLNAPIILGRSPGSGDAWNVVEQVIRDLESGRQYVLTANIKAQDEGQESPYAWRIVVRATDSQGSTSNIVDERGGATEGEITKEIPFSTPAEPEEITVRLINYYDGTSVQFDNLQITDLQSGSRKNLTFARNKSLPVQLVDRLTSISFQERNARERLVWASDAWKIMKDYPFLGTGGGGWEAYYHQYQDYLYWSSEVHNHWLQVGVETGFIGLALFALVWVSFFIDIKKTRRNADNWVKVVTAGIGAATLNLGLHSFIDFNLSLPAISFVLWSFFGISSGLSQMREGTYSNSTQRGSSNKPIIAMVVSVIIACAVFSLYIGHNTGQNAAQAAREGRLEQARVLYFRAMRFDPFTAALYIDLAQIENAIGQYSKQVVQPLFEKGLSLEPNNPSFNLEFGRFLLQQGEISEGLRYIERAKELEPYNVDNWENLARAKLAAVQYLREQGQEAYATELLLDIVAMPDEITKQSNKTPERIRDLARWPLQVTPKLQMTVGQAYYLLGDDDMAAMAFESAAKDKDIRQEIENWLDSFQKGQSLNDIVN